ncbi:MAG TPA: hypothetical protein VH639_02845 [Bryobacteraceae bacterium]|jgi:hypothetical protein
MRLFIAVISVVVAEAFSVAANIAPGALPVVKICIQNGGGNGWVVRQAEDIAAKMFNKIGVKIDWPLQHRCPPPSPQSILIQLSMGALDHPDALGYAQLGENRIEVFYDRVISMAEPLIAPSLLGHVLAHELTHLLENVSRHSDRGLMKAHWTSNDYHQMFPEAMSFDPEDVELIRAGLARRAALQ